jgi:hypothetical protein
MFDLDIHNPLQKLVMSRFLLDAKYDGLIENFVNVVPDVFAIRMNRRRKILIESAVHVPMNFDDTRAATGRNLISQELSTVMYEGVNGHYINLSARLYDANTDCLTYLRRMNLPIKMGVHEVDDCMTRYYVYFLIELYMNPSVNIYDEFLVKRRRVLSSFEAMRDSIKNSFAYKLEEHFKPDDSKRTASPFFSYSWSPYFTTRNFYDY